MRLYTLLFFVLWAGLAQANHDPDCNHSLNPETPPAYPLSRLKSDYDAWKSAYLSKMRNGFLPSHFFARSISEVLAGPRKTQDEMRETIREFFDGPRRQTLQVQLDIQVLVLYLVSAYVPFLEHGVLPEGPAKDEFYLAEKSLGENLKKLESVAGIRIDHPTPFVTDLLKGRSPIETGSVTIYNLLGLVQVTRALLGEIDRYEHIIEEYVKFLSTDLEKQASETLAEIPNEFLKKEAVQQLLARTKEPAMEKAQKIYLMSVKRLFHLASAGNFVESLSILGTLLVYDPANLTNSEGIRLADASKNSEFVLLIERISAEHSSGE